MTATVSESASLPAAYAQALLELLASWDNTATIIIHGGCVFEFKGVFPGGTNAQGYYNLHSSGNGFEGHLNLGAVTAISFQDKPHRGRDSYAFVFEGKGEVIFKVFLGRDDEGVIHQEQIDAFNRIRETLMV